MKTLKIQKILAPALVAGGMAVSGAALAADSLPADLNVKLTINSTCSINASTLQFDPQAGLTSLVDNETKLSLTCTNGTAYNIRFGNGENYAASPPPGTRQMKSNSGNVVAYEIYRESARTTKLGVTNGTNTIAGTGTGTVDTTKTVYGRVPAQSGAAIGSYTDTVKMTINY